MGIHFYKRLQHWMFQLRFTLVALLPLVALVTLLLIAFYVLLLPTIVMSANRLIAVDFEVFGRVQGVFFRKFTQEQATSLGLKGWVKNTKVQTVIGKLEGVEKMVERMQLWLKLTGSPKSRIDRVVFANQKEIDKFTFESFEIRR